MGNHDTDDSVTERGLRGLVGGGASQVSVAAALRARDAARPTDADLAAADQDLVIVRRGWVPREELSSLKFPPADDELIALLAQFPR